jgi:hypothetical protein
VAVVAGDCRGSPSLRRRGVGSPAAGRHVTQLVLKGLRLSGNITLSVLARLDRHHVPSLKGNYLSGQGRPYEIRGIVQTSGYR